MADQLVFNSELNLLGAIPTGLVGLSGTATVDYGTDTVTGSLSLTAAGIVDAQTYTDLTLVQTGFGAIPTYTLTGTNGLSTIVITYSGQLPTASDATVSILGIDVASGTGNVTSTAICFAHGTHILTERGEIMIENLAVGDRVVTPYGKTPSMEIRWIGRQHFESNTAHVGQPILVREGALGHGLPHRDLRVSGDHCLHLDGRLVPAKLLVNGNTIIAEHGNKVMDYINIELDHHTVVVAEGVESETYLDCGNRSRFDNAMEPSAWLASRPARNDSAWDNGSAFAAPLWGGPKLDALFARLADGHEATRELARVA